MLGRLLAKNRLNEGVANSEEASNPVTPHLTDEVKQKLYGTKHLDYSVSPVHRFRIVVAQELGQLMSRHNYQIVLDYVTARGSAMDHISVTELKEYIFGSPVRAKTRLKSNKFRVVSNAGVLLVTRIFYAPNCDTRLAICLSLPEPFLTSLSEIWSQISGWLDECQALLLAVLSNEQLPFLPRDLRSHDPQITQSIVHSIYTLVLPLVSAHNEIPRLLLYPSDNQDFLSSWFKDVFHWLDIKDGNRLRFLPVLFTKIVQDFATELVNCDCSRIVIISGNMAVANKLVFLISALLKPRYNGRINTVETNDDVTDQQTSTGSDKQSPAAKCDTDFSENSTKPYGTVTLKGWEIPKKKTGLSSTSVSSDGTSAQVIQPSSIKSNSSSLQYLSSSLSSAHGSYGSWFGKRMGMTSAITPVPSSNYSNSAHSPSIKASDLYEPSFAQHHNGSSTSLHQMLLSRVTPLPSPLAVEHDEFPWTSSVPSSPRTDRFREGWTSWSGSFLHNMDVRRNCNRITDEFNLENAFKLVCLFDAEMCDTTISEASETHAPVLEVPFANNPVDLQIVANELLPKYTGFLPNFVPWFQLQAFPIGLDAERKVLNAMKADLHNHSHSRTLLISLRSREIKDILVERDAATSKNVLRTKKVFASGKCGNVSPQFQQCVLSCEYNIRRAMAVWEDIVSSGDKLEALQQIFDDICG
ncbi:LADA_0E04236g1_1 [Lachancea dasiensis]|uniref:Protein LST4 n=1 Tax=Lachancea dasiensis TaxID=1072105 RepID=A0A1G4JBN0_9SACH|nr:LADA_0E04236g1_1 [Lachancea dasiensis]